MNAVQLFASVFVIYLYFSSVSGFSGTVPPECSAYANWGCNLFEDKDGLNVTVTGAGWNANRARNVTAEDELCAIVEPGGQYCPENENADCKCRMNCVDPEAGFMNWAGKPFHAPDIYRLSLKDGSTSYTPDEAVILTLETLKLGYNYRGLVLYAVRTPQMTANFSESDWEDEEHIGSWEVTDDDIYFYVTPEDSDASCRNSVMHLAAAEKPLITYFRFTAPPAGTGSITFRTLIKTGNANTGQFYRANSEDLTISEGEAKKTSLSYVRSDAGQSCSEACSQQAGLSCNNDETNSIQSEEDMDDVRANVPCSFPSFALCDTNAPAADSENDLCYYRDSESSCSAEETTCDATFSGQLSRRICACGSSGFRVSSGNLGFFVALFSLSFMLSGNNKKFAIFALVGAFVLFTAMPQQAEAHNWIFSDSRAEGSASVVFPCQPARTPKPNIQVTKTAPGNEQSFAIEWATGHGSFVYFALIDGQDEALLRRHSTTVFNNYINEAVDANPNNNIINDQNGKYHKQHRYYTGNGMPDLSTNGYVTGNAAFHSDPIIANSWDTTQPDEFIPKIDNCTARDRGNFVALRYSAEAMSGDAVVVGFESEQYPWIKGVWKYEIEQGLSGGRMDVANFWIPSQYATGRYVFHYFWNGFFDCVDVDHIENNEIETSSPCGVRPPGEKDEARVDHCWFPEPDAFFGPVMKVVDGDYKTCIARCLRHREAGCQGVMVFPMNLPDVVSMEHRDYFFEEYAKRSLDPEEWPAVQRANNQAIDYIRRLNGDDRNRAPFCTPNINERGTYLCNYLDLAYDLYNTSARDQNYAANLRSSLTAAYQSSLDGQTNDMWCAALRPRFKTNTKDILLTTDDPRNPTFYSTCLSVSDRIVFPLPGPNGESYGATKLGGDKGPFKFLDKCLDCQARRRNAEAIGDPLWELSDKCYDCDIEDSRINTSAVDNFEREYEYDMQLSVPNYRCNTANWDIREQRLNGCPNGRRCGNMTNGGNFNVPGAPGGCPMATPENYLDYQTCSIKLGTYSNLGGTLRGVPGWTASDTTYVRQVCARLASEDDRCDPNAVWIDRSTIRDTEPSFVGGRTGGLRAGHFTDFGCRCFIRSDLKPCCGSCSTNVDQKSGDGAADIYTLNVAAPLPGGNCTSPDQGVYGVVNEGEGRFVCCSPRCTHGCANGNQNNQVGQGNSRFSPEGDLCESDRLYDGLADHGDEYLCSRVGPPCIVG